MQHNAGEILFKILLRSVNFHDCFILIHECSLQCFYTGIRKYITFKKNNVEIKQSVNKMNIMTRK